MKNKIIALFVISLVTLNALSQNNPAAKNDPVGKWKFEAPYAPEGYTAGTMEVAYADKQYSATMMFTGTEYKFAADKIKFEKDTLVFNINVEGQDVTVTLKFTEVLKMAGKAVYSEGEVPLTLLKEQPAK